MALLCEKRATFLSVLKGGEDKLNLDLHHDLTDGLRFGDGEAWHVTVLGEEDGEVSVAKA